MLFRSGFPVTIYTHKTKFYNHPLNQYKGRWTNNPSQTQAILKGETGIPIVDAAVRQLHTTGYMHNRLRMVTCMLASRILNLDWRIFERWFATKLIDYYPVVNRHSWEWSVTYRFTLNPWVQQEKFDKDTEFIKHWIPELKDVPPAHIHRWYEFHKNYKSTIPYATHAPIQGRKIAK